MDYAKVTQRTQHQFVCFWLFFFSSSDAIQSMKMLHFRRSRCIYLFLMSFGRNRICLFSVQLKRNFSIRIVFFFHSSSIFRIIRSANQLLFFSTPLQLLLIQLIFELHLNKQRTKTAGHLNMGTGRSEEQPNFRIIWCE